jgi:DNA-binding XRE family transcriptional regulator
MEPMALHEIMRQRRSELNLSQADLAAKVGVDKR